MRKRKYVKSGKYAQTKRTLRDDFALVALPALVQVASREADSISSQEIAHYAYLIADAMINERTKAK